MRTTTSPVVIKKPSPMVKLYLLPRILKMLLAVFLFFAICIAGVFFFKQRAVLDLVATTAKKMVLEGEVAKAARAQIGVTQLSKNMSVAKTQFALILKQFASESQIGDLLSNITKLGTAEKLKFVYFKPEATKSLGYYAEAPVDIEVTGGFHQIARFLSGIANLPNSVVAVNQFSITSNPESKEESLTLQFVATIYYVLPTSADINV
jgi:type IV pilus assembly protein PilO